ncbi:MAG: hypothetical protein ACMXYK_03840 [Candidatus Woesearchaeota archaeon]
MTENNAQTRITKFRIPLEERVVEVDIPKPLGDSFEKARAYAIGFVGRESLDNIDSNVLKEFEKIQIDLLSLEEHAKGYSVNLGEREEKLNAFYEGLGRTIIHTEEPVWANSKYSNDYVLELNTKFVPELTLTNEGKKAIMDINSKRVGDYNLSHILENERVVKSTEVGTTLVYAEKNSRDGIYKVNSDGVTLLWDGTKEIENDKELTNFFDMLNLAGLDLEGSSGVKDFVLNRATPLFILNVAEKYNRKNRRLTIEECTAIDEPQGNNPNYASSNRKIFGEEHYDSNAGPGNQPGIDTTARKVGSYR